MTDTYKTEEELLALEALIANTLSKVKFSWEKDTADKHFKFARNPDGTIKRMFDGMPVEQNLLDLFAKYDEHRAKLEAQGINPYDEL